MSVGIVTRTKNRAVLLRRALESVKDQTYPHWQLVIVNDGGQPEPVDALVNSVFGNDKRVSVIH
ncbi:glycosyltransferase family A protein, partial [Xenorhabdus bovienii]|uniref:glycosyltransferase family A protein n=1 Tax=Xenorhabdus bovienii TaxID=40576 RepID=UPI0034D6E5C0